MAITNQTLAQVHDLRVAVGTEADDATRTVTRSWVDGWETVAPLYATALAGIAAQAVAAGHWPGPWNLVRDESLQVAGRRTQDVLADLATGAGATTATAASNAVQATIEAEPQIMATQLPAAERHDAAGKFAAALAAAGTAHLLATIAAQISSLVPPFAAMSVGAMNRALVHGAPPTSGTAKALADRVLTAVERGFNAGLTSAIGVARTETLDAYRTAARQVHNANASVVSGWYWISSLDPMTCTSCWSMHGSFHPITEFGPLDHRQGRCARVVKLRPWAQFGYGRTEPDDTFVDARAKFAALPEADQLKVMGPARLELLRSGRVQWEDLAQRRYTAGWRPSYAPTPVRDLQQIDRRA